jgi:hypothetical protein
MTFHRAVAVLLTLLALPFIAAAPASAAPTGTTLNGQRLPTGFPTDLRRFVGGTPQFRSSVWTIACKPGGQSAVPNTDPRFRWRNDAAAPGGIDVGRYLEAATPYLPLLAWWTQSEDDRIKWWKAFYMLPTHPLGDYPGDSVVARKSPTRAMLPRWPAEVAGDTVQYHWGFCSAELAKWAQPADTQIGFTWEQQLDRVTLADAAKRNIEVSQAEKTPCDKNIDNGVWCSIAYYVDCTKAATVAETDACVGWNNSISIAIDEDHKWGPQHRSMWEKFKGFFVGLAVGAVGVALDVADFFTGIYNAIKKVADFIANAATAFDKLVNELKRNAVGLVTSVVQNYNTGSAWEPGNGGFLSRYALMAGLGMILAAFMFFGAARRAMDSGKREESKDLWVRLLKTFAIILWAPALFQLLATNATKASADIVQRWTGGEAGGAVQKLTGVSRVTDSIPGGAFMGFVLFLLLFLGALGLWVGLMVQRYGMEVAATLIAFVAGAYVHPRWQRKVSKALWVVVGLILAKPLTMIVLGAAFGVINEGLSFDGSPTEVLAGLTLATIGVVTTGLAPFAALRWAPILPTAERSHDHHRGGGGLLTGAVLGAAGASLSGRAMEARRPPITRRADITGAGAARGEGGRLTDAYDKGVLGRAQSNGGTPRANGRTSPVARGGSGLGQVRRRAGGVAAVGGALAAQAAQGGLVRGRALADQQVPDVDLSEEDGR